MHTFVNNCLIVGLLLVQELICYYRMRDELANKDNNFRFKLEMYGDLDKDEILALLSNVLFFKIYKSLPLSFKERGTLQARHAL